MNKLLFVALAAAIASATLTACSGSAGSGPPAISNLGISPYVHHLAKIPSNSLFVAESNRIEVFSNAAGGWARTGEITDHVGLEPRSMAIDSTGYLFVANYTDNDVSLYRLFENGSYAGSLTKGINNPYDLALDSQDNLAVAAHSDPSKRIVRVFPSGVTDRSYELNGTSGPAALAYDSGGDLFVADADNNSVTEYNDYSNEPEQSFSVLINVPVALTFAKGLLYVANYGDYSVTLYGTSSGYGNAGEISTGGLRPVSLAAYGDHVYIVTRPVTGPKSVVIDYKIKSRKSTKFSEGLHDPIRAIICSKTYLCVANSDRRVTIYQSDKLVHTIEVKSPILSMTSR